MVDIEFEFNAGAVILLQGLETVKYKTIFKLVFLECELGPKTPKYIRIMENGKEVLCVKRFFKLNNTFVGWRV